MIRSTAHRGESASVRLLTPVAAITAVASCGALAAAADPKAIDAVYTDEPPILDGRLDDPVWHGAAIVDDLHMVMPVEYDPPSEQSEIRVLYDEEALYFSARFHDREPEHVSALVMRQGDFSWGEDGFTIMLDPMNQGRSGYIFDINPNGVRSQGLYNNVTEENWDWQAIWHGAARKDEHGWTAEVAIPFKTLSFDAGSETWGINFTRWLGRRNERFGWVSHNRDQNPAHSGRLVGLTGIRQGAGLDVVPGFRVGHVKDEASGHENSFVEPSFDAFYKITPALTGALTINTDFSGTTVDARQINLTRFDLFFPEQRQFFLQDADIFEFGLIGDDSGKPFFSRRIGLTGTGTPIDMDVGAKLTGRAGPFDIGVLGVRQETEDRADKAELVVARLAANVLAESSVGMIATAGNPAGTPDNRLLGADFRYLNTRLSPNRTVIGSLWYQHTETGGASDAAAAFGASVALPARRGWLLEAQWMEVQENYFPALGFVNRTGIHEYELETGYNWRPDAGWIRSITSGVEFWRVQTVSGEVESEELKVNVLQVENHTADYLALELRVTREVLTEPFEISDGVVIPPGDYSFGSVCLEGTTGQFRSLSAEWSVCNGEFYDGDRVTAAPYFTWRPNRHLRFGAGFEWNHIDLPYGSFITRLGSLRADVAFTTTWYWENFLQYDNVSETLGLNSILRWVPQAGRETVLVVNRQLEDFDRDNRFTPYISELVFKLAYTFRF